VRGQAEVDLTVTVVVDTVAELGGARENGGVHVVAIISAARHRDGPVLIVVIEAASFFVGRRIRHLSVRYIGVRIGRV
jgi:hypothetical protein